MLPEVKPSRIWSYPVSRITKKYLQLEADGSGIAAFTICSDHVTTPTDVATNFFLQESSVGKPIASELVQ